MQILVIGYYHHRLGFTISHYCCILAMLIETSGVSGWRGLEGVIDSRGASIQSFLKAVFQNGNAIFHSYQHKVLCSLISACY